MNPVLWIVLAYDHGRKKLKMPAISCPAICCLLKYKCMGKFPQSKLAASKTLAVAVVTGELSPVVEVMMLRVRSRDNY